jgi:UPF0242 C-terminal PAS-like domain/Uncharacterised protein family (UPF0242) N-terminus
MKTDFPFSRYNLFIAIVFCYMLPLFGLSSYHLMVPGSDQAWQQLSMGLLLSSLGSLALFYMTAKWETVLHLQYNPAEIALEQVPKQNTEELISLQKYDLVNKAYIEAQDSKHQLQLKIEELNGEIQQISMQKTTQQTILEDYRSSSHEELKLQQMLIRELQGTIEEQKNLVEKKQQQIGLLENKVSDLTYEIKTLLQIAESHTNSSAIEYEKLPSPSSTVLPSSNKEESVPFSLEKQIGTNEEASLQLKRCLDIAQKITGSNRFSQMNSFLDSPSDSFSIDLRRLCDNLRSENSCAIIFYSPKENQLLFANNQIRGLTGWSPEKFVQNFSKLLVGEQVWKNGIAALAMRNEVALKISFKSKAGPEIEVNAHIGMIPTGIFKYHILAVLYTVR